MAVEELAQLLMTRFGLSRTEAFLLVSARGDVRIGQCARIRDSTPLPTRCSPRRSSGWRTASQKRIPRHLDVKPMVSLYRLNECRATGPGCASKFCR